MNENPEKPEKPLDVWFWRWLERHQRLCGYDVMTRTKDGNDLVDKLVSIWVSPSDLDFYGAWKRMFRELGITRHEAADISDRLQINRPTHPDRHPEAIKDHLREIRRIARDRQAIARSGIPGTGRIVAAMPECKDCPECEGTGLARRHWSSPGLPSPMMVDLLCRCPAGSHRRETLDRRDLADLQSLPELWSPWLSHPSWSPSPTEPPSHRPSPDGWFLPPSPPVEPSPAKKAPKKPAKPSADARRALSPPMPPTPAREDARPIPERLHLVGCPSDPIIDREIAVYEHAKSPQPSDPEQDAELFFEAMAWL